MFVVHSHRHWKSQSVNSQGLSPVGVVWQWLVWDVLSSCVCTWCCFWPVKIKDVHRTSSYALFVNGSNCTALLVSACLQTRLQARQSHWVYVAHTNMQDLIKDGAWDDTQRIVTRRSMYDPPQAHPLDLCSTWHVLETLVWNHGLLLAWKWLFCAVITQPFVLLT